VAVLAGEHEFKGLEQGSEILLSRCRKGTNSFTFRNREANGGKKMKSDHPDSSFKKKLTDDINRHTFKGDYRRAL
jgi:hypothetical protein